MFCYSLEHVEVIVALRQFSNSSGLLALYHMSMIVTRVVINKQ